MTLAPEPIVGVPEIDSEHAVQIELLREVERATHALDRDTALSVMKRLADYTDAHFASEQILMRLHAYPNCATHEAEHGALLAEFGRIHKRLAFDDRADLAQSLSGLPLAPDTHSDLGQSVRGPHPSRNAGHPFLLDSTVRVPNDSPAHPAARIPPASSVEFVARRRSPSRTSR
jgi:hemerythrin-like metal-binding protein